MKGDFSRDTFDPAKHFSRVLMQQGRVQLDADWNEQVASLLHYMRTLAADLIGPFAGPTGVEYGFEIQNLTADDFMIRGGRYYVDGILCENEGNVTYKKQKDYPVDPKDPLPASEYLVYLDVWERHITPIEDDDIREKALGGPDTASRAKVIWQVRFTEKKPVDMPSSLTKGSVLNSWEGFVAVIENRQADEHGCLAAQVKPEEDSKDPCITAPTSQYRGPENQLYRIEIHQASYDKDGKTQDPTFKWSRENGSIASFVEKVSDTEYTLQRPRGFEAGQWVELTTDERDLTGLPGVLAKVKQVDSGRLILDNLDKTVSIQATKVRRWDQRGPKGDIDIPKASDWIDLEHGIQIKFSDGIYRTGDYWLIPARVATGDIEWPGGAIPPYGIRHHYAPLAIVQSDGHIEDCRCSFVPLSYSCSAYYSYGEEGIGGHLLCAEDIEEK